MKYVKRLPKNSSYLYCTESFDSKIVKVYRGKKCLYLVTSDSILSYTRKDLKDLSNKLYDAYGKIKDPIVEYQQVHIDQETSSSDSERA